MKIVHLVTSPIGGAANAALRLNDALQSEGFDSIVVSVARRKTIKLQNYHQQQIGLLSKLLSSTTTFIQKTFVQNGSDTVSTFSLDLLNWESAEIAAADVIHLHAFYNLVTINNFLSQHPEKVKIVTLHDERFYTGGCHYSHGCESLTNGCVNCPQVRTLFRKKVLRERKRVRYAIQNFPDVIFVCPSDWIRSQALKALPDSNVSQFKTIFNPIPPSNKALLGKSTITDKITFGFIAQNLQNPIKNLDLLLRAFNRISATHPEKYKLKLIGRSIFDYSSVSPHINQTNAVSYVEMQEIFSDIDALVVPSTHDNLPNVLGEALMNGVAVIGSAVGGIPEVLRLFEQHSFESDNEDSLFLALLEFKKPNREELRLKAEKVFGYKAIAHLMIETYRGKVN